MRRGRLYSAFFRRWHSFVASAKLGRSVAAFGPITIDGPGEITVGQGLRINHSVHIVCRKKLEIGNNVTLSTGTRIIDTGLILDEDTMKEHRNHLDGLIIIGNNVWIGAGATVLSNVMIGEGAVIGAGALVNKDVPPNTLWAGVPARKLRDL